MEDMANEDNNLPGLDELVFFEDDALADFSDDPRTQTIDDGSSQGIDPTEIETEDDPEQIEDNTDDINDDTDDDSSSDDDSSDDTTDSDPEDIDETNDEPEGDDGADVQDTEYTPYYNFLQKQGLLLLGDDFEFDGSAESFEKAVETTRNNMANQGARMIWDQLPEDYKLVLEHGLAGGNDINSIKETISSQTKLEDLDLEDEVTQEQIVENYLRRTTKYNDQRISRSIARLKASGELEEEAETALGELKDIYKEERDALIQKQLEEKQANEKQLQESYSNYVNIVQEMDMPDTRKKRLVSSVWSLGDYGEYKNVSYFNYVDYKIKNNPEHLAQLAELYLDYDPEKGFKSDKARKKVKSDVTRSFRDDLDNLNKTKSRTKSGKSRKPKSKSSDVDLLEQILNNK